MTSPAPTRLLRAATLAAGAAMVVASAPAHAAATKWLPITDSGKYGDQVGLARTADGTLHVAAPLHAEPGTTSLIHRTITPNGGVTPSIEFVAPDWQGLNGAELLGNADGTITAVFAGQRSSTEGDPYREGRALTATRSADGTWTLGPTITPTLGSPYAADRIAAVRGGDGQLLTAWGVSSGLLAHLGTDPEQPNLTLQDGCCAYGAALATDATGITGAWYSNQDATAGVRARLASGQIVTAPGAKKVLPVTERLGLTGRGDRSYLAYAVGYPSTKKVALWQLGTSRPAIVVGAKRANHVTSALGTDGRMWIAWEQDGLVRAARTNKSVTTLGAIVSVRSKQAVKALAGDGSTGPLDLVASRGTAGIATIRIKPGLTLTKTKKGYRVTDAGAPVKGAKITKTRHKVTASKAGYTSATLRVR